MYQFRYYYLSLWAYLFKGCGEAIDGGLSTAVNLVARNTTEIWYSINFVLKGAWGLIIDGIRIAYNIITIIKSCILFVLSLQTFSFWILSKWSNMHAAFQISGFFWSPIFVSYIWVSCGQEKFYNFFFYVCPFSSLVAHNTIAEQQGTKLVAFIIFPLLLAVVQTWLR